MKKYWRCYILSLALCLAGILFRYRLNILDKAFVLLGVAVFLLTFVTHCTSKAPRCPNCNAVIHSGHIRNIKRQNNGIVPCEKCGSLVCVDHARRK